MGEQLISNMPTDEFDAVVDAFIERETKGMGELDAPLFYEVLKEAVTSDTTSDSTTAIELEGEIVNNQLIFHLPMEKETAVYVKGNEIVIGDQRIVVKFVGSNLQDRFSDLPSDAPELFGIEGDVRSVNFDSDPFGTPIASGTFLTTEYESLGIVLNEVQVSSSVYGGPASAPNTTYTAAVPGEGLQFQFQVPVAAVGFINTSPDQDLIEFFDSEGELIFSTRDQMGLPKNFNVDRFVGYRASADRPIASMRVSNNTGNLELDELIFVPVAASYQYPVEALDPDFDPIRFTLDEAPQGMIINPQSGLVSWNPTGDQLGLHTVRVVASDGQGGEAVQEYQLRVLADPQNTDPVIVTRPVDEFYVPGFSNPPSGAVSPQRISLDLGNGQAFEGTVSITLPEDADRFADIVLAVDESQSMGGDQAWLVDMIPLLDQALVAEGIGASPDNPNRFAIVGGGRQNMVSHFLSQQPNTRYVLYGPDNRVVAEGMIDEVLPDAMLNLDLPADGRYKLVVEPHQQSDLSGGIDLGFRGQTGPAQRVEPLTLNQVVDDEFDLPGQPVVYTFSLATSALLYFDSLIVDHYSTIEWRLTGPGGLIDSQTSIDLSDTSNPTPAVLVGAGQYELTLKSTRDTAVDYKFQLLDLFHAAEIESGDTVRGQFLRKVSTEAFRFTGSAGQRLQLITEAVAHAGSKWRILNSDGQVLETQNLGENLGGFVLPETGDYFLILEAAPFPYDGSQQIRQDSTFQFSLEIFDPEPPTEIALGETVTGALQFTNDFVDYAFEVGQRSLVYLDSLTDSAIGWSLEGPWGTVAQRQFNNSDSFDYAQPVYPLVPGSYQLRVSSNTLVGPYSFRVLDLATAAPVVPGVPFDGELTTSSQTNLYRFDALAGEQFFFDVLEASDTQNSLYRLIDPYGQTVFTSTRMLDTAAVRIPADGRYTLLVEGWRGNQDADTYRLNIVPVTTRQVSLTLGQIETETLANPGETIEYAFDLSQEGLLYLDALTNEASLQWSLSGPLGEVVSPRGFSQTDSTGALDGPWVAPAGNYQLRVWRTADAIGEFQFQLTDLRDPAQTTPLVPEPGSVNPQVTVSTSIRGNESHLYRFNAQAGDVFNFDSTLTGSNNGSYRLVDAQGREIFEVSSLASDRSSQALALGGTYYLLVESRLTNVTPAEMDLELSWLRNDGPTVLAGTPMSLGSVIEGDLATAGQQDQYTFSISQPTLFYLDAQTNNGSFRWYLRDAIGDLVVNRAFTSTDSFNNNNPVLSLPAGDYQLEILASSGTPGVYRFVAQDLAAAPLLTPGQSFSDTLDPGNVTHLYRLAAMAGESYFFDVEAGSDTTNTQYKLIDPAGRVVQISDRLTDRGPVTLDLDGDYTLLVEGWRGNVGPDTYQINVHRLDPTVIQPAVLGETIEGAIHRAGQVVSYGFTLDDWSLLHLDSRTGVSQLRWSLQGPAGTLVSARRMDLSDSSSIQNPVVEAAPGDYVLEIDGLGDYLGPFEFALLNLGDGTTLVPGTPVQDRVNHNDGTAATWGTGVNLAGATFNGAVDLSSDLSTVQLPGDALDGLSDHTIEFWYRTEKSTEQVLISAARASEDNELLLRLMSDTEVRLEGVGSWTVPSLADGQWHHLALTSAAGVGTTFYLDGVSQGALSATLGTLEVDSGGLFLGQDQDVLGGRFDTRQSASGQFDELRIWNVAREAADIAADRSRVIDPGSAGLEGYWRFDETAGTTVVDQSPLGRDGEFLSLSRSNSTRVYRFQADPGDKVFFDIQDADANFLQSPYWRLVDARGQQLHRAAFDNDLGPMTLQGGEYFLLVEGRVTDHGLQGGFSLELVPLGNELDPAESTPLEFGSIIDGEISVRHQTDRYTFTLDQPASIYFDALTNDASLTWTLARPGRELVSRNFRDSDGDRNPTPVYRLAAGEYTVSITSPDVEGYRFRILDLAQATPIVKGLPVDGSFVIPSQTNHYAFAGVAGERLFIDMLSTSSAGGASYRIVDAQGRVLLTSATLSDQAGFIPEQDGTYFLLLEADYNQTTSHSYQFQLVRSATIEQRVNVGELVTGELLVPGDRQQIVFVLDQRETLYFDSQSSAGELVWTLEGPAGQLVVRRPMVGSDSFDRAQPWLELEPGEYRVVVEGTGDAVGEFQFRWLSLGSATEVQLNTAFEGQLETPNETDLFQFSAIRGQSLLVDIESASDPSWALYRVIDPYGHTIHEQRSLTDFDGIPLDVTGVYTLTVEGDIDNVDADTYRINLRPQTVRDGGVLTLGTAITGNVGVPGESVDYRFTLANDTRVHFDSRTNANQLVWSLRGPRGTEVTDVSFARSDSTWTSSTSNPRPAFDLVAGDYTLSVSGLGDEVGEFEYALWDLLAPGQSTLAARPQSGSPMTLTGQQSDPLQSQIFRFEAEAGDQWNWSSSSNGGAGDYRLLDPYGRQLFRGALGSSQSMFEMPLAGTYHLIVEGRPTNTTLLDFSIQATHEGQVPQDPLVGNQLTLGSLVTGSLDTGDQVDSFRFTLGQRQQVHFDSHTNSGSHRWRLKGPRGLELDNVRFDYSDAFRTTEAVLGGGPLEAGEYQLDVYAASGTPGAYGFKLIDVATAAPLIPGTPVSGTFDPANESHLYRFAASAGDSFFFDVVDASDRNRGIFKLIDPFGRTVLTSNRLNDGELFTVEADGEYRLILEGEINNTGQDSWTFNVVPFELGRAPLNVNALNADQIGAAGGQLRFDFSLAQDALFYFDPIDEIQDLQWSVEGADGYRTPWSRFNLSASFASLKAGDYELVIDGIGDYIGAVEFNAYFSGAQTTTLPLDGTLVNDSLETAQGVQIYQFQGFQGQRSLLPAELFRHRQKETAPDL